MENGLWIGGPWEKKNNQKDRGGCFVVNRTGVRVDGGEGRRQGVQRMALEGSERVDIGGGS